MKKGYKGTYDKLHGEFINIYEGAEGIPEELMALFLKWKRYGAENDAQFIKENPHACPLKYVSEKFRYEGRNYIFYPESMDVCDPHFENLMMNCVEDELVALGAEEVFCTAMVD